MTEVTTNVKEGEWKSFLDSCDAASIFHTPEWKCFLEKTFGYKPHYLFSKDENGNVDGLLPLFYVKSKLTGNRLCSVPFSHICGPIGNKKVFNSLTGEAINTFDDSKTRYIEIRDYVQSNKFDNHNSFSDFILDVSGSIDNLWRNLSRDVRKNTTKSKKKGASVRITQDCEDLMQFYELNSITKRSIGVPCHPWKFFKNMFEIFKENVSLYVVEYNGKIIAGGVRSFYKDTVNAKYSAANPNFSKLHAYNALNWKCIEDACNNKYKYYDFGRVSNNNKGLMFFKSRWGTTEKKLYYSFYPKNPMSLAENRDNLKYRLITKVIRKMPLSIYQEFSNRFFGDFG